MQITKNQLDKTSAIIKIDIEKADYSKSVENVIKDYTKKANIPGFRKGNVPFGIIKKKYGTSIISEEVNKLIDKSLGEYLTNEKFNILGKPLPIPQSDFTWDNEIFSFEFEIGITPEISIALESQKVTYYDIIVEQKMIDKQVIQYQKHFGKKLSQATISDESNELTAIFESLENDIKNTYTFEVSQLKSETTRATFLGKKCTDVIIVKTKGLFNNETDLEAVLGIADTLKDDIKLSITIKEINKREPAELNQAFYDKLFGKGVVKTKEEFKKKIEDNFKFQFSQQADQKFFNDTTDTLIKKITFSLPEKFLKKWMRYSGEKTLSEEEADSEYKKAEKGLRYQLIENEIVNKHSIQNKPEELKTFIKEVIKLQMGQYGQENLSDKELMSILENVIKNPDETKRFSGQLTSQKLTALYKEKITTKRKKVTYDEFQKII